MGWFSKTPQEDPKTEKLRKNLKSLEEVHKIVLDRGDINEITRFEEDIKNFKIDIANEQDTNSSKYRFLGASSDLQKRQAERVNALSTLNKKLDMISKKKTELRAISSTNPVAQPTPVNSVAPPSTTYPVFTVNEGGKGIDITINGNIITLKIGDSILVTTYYSRTVKCIISDFIATGGLTSDPIDTMIVEIPNEKDFRRSYYSIPLTEEASRSANNQFSADLKTIKLLSPTGPSGTPVPPATPTGSTSTTSIPSEGPVIDNYPEHENPKEDVGKKIEFPYKLIDMNVVYGKFPLFFMMMLRKIENISDDQYDKDRLDIIDKTILTGYLRPVPLMGKNKYGITIVLPMVGPMEITPVDHRYKIVDQTVINPPPPDVTFRYNSNIEKPYGGSRKKRSTRRRHPKRKCKSQRNQRKTRK